MGTVKIITVDKNMEHWCRQIAMLHGSRITAGFLPLLGLPLLTRVYRHAAKEAILIAAVDGDELLGFAMGSVSVRRFYLRFAMQNLFPLGFNLLRRPAILRRALSGGRYAAQTKAAAAPELLRVAVSTRAGPGVAMALIREWCARIASLRHPSFHIAVSDTQSVALAMYACLGASEIGRTDIGGLRTTLFTMRSTNNHLSNQQRSAVQSRSLGTVQH